MDAVRLQKFKRRAPDIGSAEHLQKILDTFAPEDREKAFQSVLPLLNPKTAKQLEDSTNTAP